MRADDTELIVSRRGERSIRQFSVTVIGGPDVGRRAISAGTELVVGSAEGNDLLLTDPTVSRIHCSISVAASAFLLRDIRSKNGTSVQGVRVEGAYLRPGDVVLAGKSALRFEPMSECIQEELSTEESFAGMVGRSAAMRRIFALLPRIAASEASVLIEGPTGTGKELVAEAIHEGSHRSAGPFVVLDCASIAATLVESELFGHEKGAFTGAHAQRLGAFEAAAGGTIFLDEIGELPLDMQVKLLRVLEDRTVRRVGATRSIALDVRVVSATNRDLRAEVNAGSFRADLYYRLSVAPLKIPPLGERREDIPALVAHFFRELGGQGLPPAELVSRFVEREWPGNVRELRAAVERAMLFGDAGEEPLSGCDGENGGRSRFADADFDASTPFRVAKERFVHEWEKWYASTLLRRFQTVSRAAREVQMDRHHLGEIVRRHRL
jgi:DNA-binding NtrC family response regulator